MTEINDNNSKPNKSRRAAAVIAGSALTLSTAAFGVPAAFADGDHTPQLATEDQATEGAKNTEENQLEVAPNVNKIHAGETVTVSGSGFTPNSNVQLAVGSEFVVDAQADENGDLAAEVTIPEEFEDGSYDLAVSDVETGEVTYADLKVLDDDDREEGDDWDDEDDRNEGPEVEMESDDIEPGETLQISGEDFTANGNVTLSWNSEQNTAADEHGNISTEIFVPEDAEEGSYEVVVTDQATGQQETEDFTVEVDDRDDKDDDRDDREDDHEDKDDDHDDHDDTDDDRDDERDDD